MITWSFGVPGYLVEMGSCHLECSIHYGHTGSASTACRGDGYRNEVWMPRERVTSIACKEVYLYEIAKQDSVKGM